VLIEPEWVAECTRLFAGLPAYLIGIRCSLEILEQRERKRKDRTLVQARAYQEKVHTHGLYDLEVDTGKDDPETCAQQVIDFLASKPAPRAFPALALRGQQKQLLSAEPDDQTS
jgi:chloramphenicol 3-O phosphotransferase